MTAMPSEIIPHVDCLPKAVPAKPPRMLKSPKPGMLRHLLSSRRSLTSKDSSQIQCQFDGQFHREDDITHGVSDNTSKQADSALRNMPVAAKTIPCKETSQKVTRTSTHAQSHNFAVISIDIGATESGYAFCFTREPYHELRRYALEELEVVSQKSLTSILLTPDGQFHSFGYSARSNYLNLSPTEAQHWLYFTNFKAELYDNVELNLETLIEATNGLKFSAFRVFRFLLEFFKKEALLHLRSQSWSIHKIVNITWVITVPASENASAKQFMRQAAHEARIVSTFPGQLLIIEESEAASIYCHTQRLRSRTYQSAVTSSSHADGRRLPFTTDDHDDACLTLGSRYLVVDCGGGSVDITVNELDHSGYITEVHRVNGGPYGSLGADVQFEGLLRSIFGVEFVEHYKRTYPIGWLHLLTDFESRKRSFCPSKSSHVTISPSFTFINEFIKHRCDPETAVHEYGDWQIDWSPQGMLKLTGAAVRKLFLPLFDHIRQAVGDVLNHHQAREIKAMFLVGGLAQSNILQHELVKEFSNIVKVVTPDDAIFAVLKGALHYGLDPLIFRTRRSKFVYGVGILSRFDSKYHPPCKRVRRNGLDWCVDIFDKFIESDEPVLGKTREKNYTLSRPDQTCIQINVYSSVNPQVIFTTDPGVTRCSTLSLSLPAHTPDFVGAMGDTHPSTRVIQTCMTFNETEITVVVVDIWTGHMIKANVDFL